MDGKIWRDLRGLVMKVWDWFDRCYRFVFIFLIDIFMKLLINPCDIKW